MIVDLCPKLYYPNNNNAHLINFPDGTLIPVDDDGVIPFIVVCKPTKYNVEYCKRISLTSKSDLDPYGQWGSFSKVEAQSNGIESVIESFEGTDPISANLSYLSLGVMISDTPVFHKSNNMAKKKNIMKTCTVQ